MSIQPENTMNAIQREYLHNVRRALKVADSVKFNRVAYDYQARNAQSYWSLFLKASANTRFQDNVNRMKDFLNSHDIRGALMLASP
jgi:hypothetical protein